MKKILLLLTAVLLINTASQAQCNVHVYPNYTIASDSLYTFNATITGGTAPYSVYWYINVPGTTIGFSGTGNPYGAVVLNPATTYYMTCVVFDANQCGDTMSVPVSVPNYATPGASTCTANFTLVPSSVQGVYNGYNYSTGSNLVYYWNWGDGSSSTTQYPSHTYANPGMYSICLAVSNNSMFCNDSMCVNYSIIRGSSANAIRTINFLDPNATGVKNIATANVNLYPNPATNVLNIETNGNAVHQLKIVSVTGQVVMEKEIVKNQIDISKLPAGVYFTEMKINDNIARSKFIKE